jgi:hypothetical protein
MIIPSGIFIAGCDKDDPDDDRPTGNIHSTIKRCS